MLKAVERAHAIGAGTLQIFSDNPTTWRRRAAPPSDLAAFCDALTAHDLGPIAIHASYLVNLAGPEPTFFERSIELLADELRVAPGFRARYVNVHVGSHRERGVDAGVARVADGIARVLALADGGRGFDEDAPMLVLENSAGSGFGLGTDVTSLAAIAEAVAARGVAARRVGFCLDAAHAWGAGIDLSDPAALDAFLDEFDDRIGLDRLVMVHLNDSKVERGSNLDRHEHLGAGRIGEAGLAHLVTHPRLAGATYYLETPGMDEGYDAVNVARAYDLAAGRPLATLPPEAMTVRGSRARTAPRAAEPA